jgi:hypothetical protein
MKKSFLLLTLILICINLMSQIPMGFNYQAVARDAAGNVLTNKAVAFRVSILSGSETGTAVYSEVQKPTTNSFGLVNFVIGDGTSKSGSLESIDWSANTYFVKVELDPDGGTSYQLMGASQLMSVPYSLHAKTVEVDNVDDADADPTNEIQSLSISGSNLTLSKGGGTVVLPSAVGGDNWGTQTAATDATLTGNGSSSTPLKIAQQSASSGQALKWNGTTWKPGNVDADSLNELQVLSLSGRNLTLSKGGGSVTLPSSAGGLTLPFSDSANYSVTPFSINNNGSALYSISGVSTNGYGIHGKTKAPDGAGVLGIGTGSYHSSGVTGWTGEGIYSPVYNSINYGVLGLSNEDYAIAGFSISGTGGFFKSNTGLAVKTIGNLQLTGIGEADRRVLTSDASGNATWQDAVVGGLALPFNGITSNANPAFQITNNGTGDGIKGIAVSSGETGIIGEAPNQGISGNATAISGPAYGVQGTSASSSGSGVTGYGSSVTGQNFGVRGLTSSSAGKGVYGVAASSSGVTYGLYGESISDAGWGIFGKSPHIGVEGFGTGTSVESYGVVGETESTSGFGVRGGCFAATGTNYGTWGISTSTSGIGAYGTSPYIGVQGVSTGTTGYGISGTGTKIGVSGGTTTSNEIAYAIIGETQSTSGTGVWGGSYAESGTTYGVYGMVNSPTGTGVYGTSPNIGVRGVSQRTTGWAYGVYGSSASTSAGRGVYGTSPYAGVHGYGSGSTEYSYGVIGETSSTQGFGVYGASYAETGINYGALGSSSSSAGTGVKGQALAPSGATYGVYGVSSSNSGTGVYGEAGPIGVKGSGIYADGIGVQGTGGEIGVNGISSNSSGFGVFGQSPYIGVKGIAQAASGYSYGIYGETNSTYGFGVYGSSPYVGVFGIATIGTGWAGYFSGTLATSGNLGVGNAYPNYMLDVSGTANLNRGTETGVALRVNDSEAIWYNGTYYSWGYGGTWNFFGDKVFIGAVATDPGANMLVVNGAAAKPGGGSWTTWSDSRLKDIHGNYEKGLMEIIQLQPVKYSYKKDNARSLPSDKNYVGFVAQDIQKVFPEAVNEESDGYLTVDENALNVAVINAIKELKREIDKLKSENIDLKAANNQLKSENEQLDSRLSRLEKYLGTTAEK